MLIRVVDNSKLYNRGVQFDHLGWSASSEWKAFIYFERNYAMFVTLLNFSNVSILFHVDKLCNLRTKSEVTGA